MKKILMLLVGCAIATHVWAGDEQLSKKDKEHRDRQLRMLSGKTVDVPLSKSHLVLSDKQLEAMEKTREQINAECPECEFEWRKAWSVMGTKSDNWIYKKIRKESRGPSTGGVLGGSDK